MKQYLAFSPLCRFALWLVRPRRVLLYDAARIDSPAAVLSSLRNKVHILNRRGRAWDEAFRQ